MHLAVEACLQLASAIGSAWRGPEGARRGQGGCGGLAVKAGQSCCSATPANGFEVITVSASSNPPERPKQANDAEAHTEVCPRCGQLLIVAFFTRSSITIN
jgi:hypothetical protein